MQPVLSLGTAAGDRPGAVTGGNDWMSYGENLRRLLRSAMTTVFGQPSSGDPPPVLVDTTGVTTRVARETGNPHGEP